MHRDALTAGHGDAELLGGVAGVQDLQRLADDGSADRDGDAVDEEADGEGAEVVAAHVAGDDDHEEHVAQRRERLIDEIPAGSLGESSE